MLLVVVVMNIHLTICKVSCTIGSDLRDLELLVQDLHLVLIDHISLTW